MARPRWFVPPGVGAADALRRDVIAFALILALVPGEVRPILLVRNEVYEQVEGEASSRHHEALQALYRSSGYQPVWTDSGRATRQALAMIRRLQRAEEKGLRPDDYEGSSGPEWIESMEPAEFDLLLSTNVIQYVADLRYGRVKPQALRLGLRVKDDELALGTVVHELSRAEDVEPVLAALEPDVPVYRRTLEAMNRYLALAAREPAASIPASAAAIDPRTYAALPLLVERLRLMGDLAASAPASEKEVRSALERFQARHALAATGRIDLRKRCAS
jgi:L,D-transpeptidase YcbB